MKNQGKEYTFWGVRSSNFKENLKISLDKKYSNCNKILVFNLKGGSFGLEDVQF